MQLRAHKPQLEEGKSTTPKLVRRMTTELGRNSGKTNKALHNSLEKGAEKPNPRGLVSKFAQQASKKPDKDCNSARLSKKPNACKPLVSAAVQKLQENGVDSSHTPKIQNALAERIIEEAKAHVSVIHEIDENEDVDDIVLEASDILQHNTPPAFLVKMYAGKSKNKTPPEEEKKECPTELERQIPGKKQPKLLAKAPMFTRNKSPIGEDTDDLMGVEIDVPEDILDFEEELPREKPECFEEEKQKIASLQTAENSSGCPSGVSSDFPFSQEKAKLEKVNQQSFIAHKLLGKGSFGEVYLVEKLNTKKMYAMKILSKAKIMSQNLVKYAITERKVLSTVNHPFIVKLHFAFQSSSKLFLVLDYCAGGDLSEYLRREKKFTEERAKIYVAELLLALEYLHKKDIIFRDLKPDNVVLDSQGHALLTDFGLSKEGIYDNQGAKSFCGSLAYLAPEMIKRKGHGKSVDWYLLGVLLYEMLVGVPPYYSANKDELFFNIQQGILKIPSTMSEEARSLILGLLNRNPNKRLGAGPLDADEIKKQTWFADLNWEDVYHKKLTPPVPLIKKTGSLKEVSKIVESERKSDTIEGWSFVNLSDTSI